MRRLQLGDYSEIGTILTELMARGPKGPKCLWLSQASGTGDSIDRRDHFGIVWENHNAAPSSQQMVVPTNHTSEVVGQDSATLGSLQMYLTVHLSRRLSFLGKAVKPSATNEVCGGAKESK